MAILHPGLGHETTPCHSLTWGMWGPSVKWEAPFPWLNNHHATESPLKKIPVTTVGILELQRRHFFWFDGDTRELITLYWCPPCLVSQHKFKRWWSTFKFLDFHFHFYHLLTTKIKYACHLQLSLFQSEIGCIYFNQSSGARFSLFIYLLLKAFEEWFPARTKESCFGGMVSDKEDNMHSKALKTKKQNHKQQKSQQWEAAFCSSC